MAAGYCWYPSTSPPGGPGGVRVLPVLPPRPALTEQVPALVKRLFSGTKTLPLLFRAELAPRELTPEVVLGVDQLTDPGHDVLVIHVHKVCRPLSGARPGYALPRTGACATARVLWPAVAGLGGVSARLTAPILAGFAWRAQCRGSNRDPGR